MSDENVEAKSILAIGAHPDDIEFGCGGILLKEARNGSRIHLLVCSQGESGTNGTPEIREAEARKAAGLLDATLSFAELGGDGQMGFSVENANTIARVIREVRPDIVLAPALHANQHPDHAVVGGLTQNACRLARYGNLEALKPLAKHSIKSLFFYLISSTESEMKGTRVLVDVSPVVDDWKALMACHASQMKTRDYIDLQMSKARALGLSAGVEYAIQLASNDPLVSDSLSTLPPTGRAL